MNHKHRKVPHAIFSRSVSANISARGVESIFDELGGKIEQCHTRRLGVHLNGQFAEISHDAHALSPEHERTVCKYLTEAGVGSGCDYPL